MSSLQELLANEGFNAKLFKKHQKKVKFRDKPPPDESVALPIYICHDRKSFEFTKPKTDKSSTKNGSSIFSSKRGGSDSGKSEKTESTMMMIKKNSSEAAIDEAAIKAVISILSGYVGQYFSDENFRKSIREKCYSCFNRRKSMDFESESDKGIFINMELGIESIEKLVENQGTKTEIKMKSLRNSIGFLSIVASLNSKATKNGSTCGTPNSHLSACAQLYLSIVYKIERNDRISARHLLQVFVDSPVLARTHLLPELWEHFFLPHLLHIKIWYGKEFDNISNSEYREKEKKIKALNEVYNEQMDKGTLQFALYYKEWLKTGVEAPTFPSLPLPSTSIYGNSRRRRSSESYTSHSSINKSLYRTVFGSTIERKSMDFDDRTGDFINTWDLEEQEKFCSDEDNNVNGCIFIQSRTPSHRRSSGQSYRKSRMEPWLEPHKPDYFRFLSCKGEPEESSRMSINGSIKKTVHSHLTPSNELSNAISTLSSSESLADCEKAVHVITKSWLDSQGDPVTQTALTKPPVIKGMLEVLFASNDEEVLELAISILAEVVSRKDTSAKIILNSDPQLEIFLRLLRSSSLFLKAAVLLYLIKPKAKQMISAEWVPLVLRVLEFGDQIETLFTVRCSPQVAAYYLLDQLLGGFDEDKNRENARQVVSLGGLSILVKRLEIGDICEKGKSALIIRFCIGADGRCRHYLANNLNTDSVLTLLVLGKEMDSHRHAFALLTELLCLHRSTQRRKFMNELTSGWGSLSTMQILLVYLQKARQEERPVVAAMLLQLDLMGDPLKCSAYREEAIEAIIEALDCQICNEKVQEQSARALSILGSHFSYTGEPSTEKWLLKEAGFHESLADSFRYLDNEEDEETENWQRKSAMVLLNSGKEKLLAALSDCIANGVPILARASLVTISWMIKYLDLVVVNEDENVQCDAAASILVPQLVQCLGYDRAVEERVLASYSLLNLAKTSDYLYKVCTMNKELVNHLKNLSRVTWTAGELISILKCRSKIR